MATTANMKAIQTIKVGSGGAANIEFTNIPQTYTDLLLVISARSVASYVDQNLQFNGTTANRSGRTLMGRGNSIESQNVTTSIELVGLVPSGDTVDTFGSTYVYIPNYTSSNNKSVSIKSVTENNGTVAYAYFGGALWANTSAITSIKTLPTANGYAQHTTATLYGITSVSKGVTPKATGGTITETDTHIIHTFNATGSFIPSQNLTCDFLVVGGGGGAGNNGNGGWPGGGGGAGGYRTATAQAFTSGTTYTMTIGGGGGSQSGGSGSSISGTGFTTFSTSGGGYGGTGAGSSGQGGQAGSGGGSGGGGSSNGDPSATNSGGSGNAGGYTPVEGYRGGDGRWQPGGAGGSSSRPGGALWTGTVGTFNDISGTSVEYAHGGAPGSGGSDSPWLNGLANRGYGGDGGNGANAVGRSGGSGVVIIRYAK